MVFLLLDNIRKSEHIRTVLHQTRKEGVFRRYLVGSPIPSTSSSSLVGGDHILPSFSYKKQAQNVRIVPRKLAWHASNNTSAVKLQVTTLHCTLLTLKWKSFMTNPK